MMKATFCYENCFLDWFLDLLCEVKCLARMTPVELDATAAKTVWGNLGPRHFRKHGGAQTK